MGGADHAGLGIGKQHRGAVGGENTQHHAGQGRHHSIAFLPRARSSSLRRRYGRWRCEFAPGKPACAPGASAGTIRARLAATAAGSSREPGPQFRLAYMPPDTPPLAAEKAVRDARQCLQVGGAVNRHCAVFKIRAAWRRMAAAMPSPETNCPSGPARSNAPRRAHRFSASGGLVFDQLPGPRADAQRRPGIRLGRAGRYICAPPCRAASAKAAKSTWADRSCCPGRPAHRRKAMAAHRLQGFGKADLRHSRNPPAVRRRHWFAITRAISSVSDVAAGDVSYTPPSGAPAREAGIAAAGVDLRRQREFQCVIFRHHHALAPAARGLHILADRQGVEEFIGEQQQRRSSGCRRNANSSGCARRCP